MKSFMIMLFSLMAISSIIVFSSIENSYSDKVTATNIGFEYSTILELKNNRGNTDNIDSVRIWLNEDNEFKSFKTEQGWIGKKQLNGVIEFTAYEGVNPGDGVKFGIKTLEKNPTIHWKALDSRGDVISSASTIISESGIIDNNKTLNQPKVIGIKEDSIFRFIPEKPGANSSFRVIGENFVPNQNLDFYIDNKLKESIQVDKDGKILFTSQIPDIENDERTEFVLRDTGGTEKLLSLRISDSEKRIISQGVKLTLGNTPQEVKRGETITLEGVATPNSTLTITSKLPNGDILAINTIQVGFDGKWSYDNLFSPELELGTVSIEIDDGKSKALRNIEVISSRLINIETEYTKYEPGDVITFEGTGIPNKNMSIILEDSIGTEIVSRSVSTDDSGNIKFNIEIPRGSMDGTYVLLAFQDNEEGVTIFGVGQEPQPILVLRPSQLNYSTGETVRVTIQGPSNAQVSIIIIDSADREKISNTINLGPDGKEVYEIESSELPNGAYTMDARRGESSGSTVFTVGLTTGSGAISVQTTKDDYKPGDQILILGNTGANNVLLDVTITDPDGKIIKRIETFSDKFSVFKVDNFRIPSDAVDGIWNINVKSGGNFSNTSFVVTTENQGLTVSLNKKEYNIGEMVNILGTGARMSATVTIGIYDSENILIDELNITAKSNGEFSTIWLVPVDLEEGEYELRFDDGAGNTNFTFTVKS